MLPRVQIESRVAALGIPQLVDVRDQQRSTVRRRGALAGGWGRTGIHVTSGGTDYCSKGGFGDFKTIATHQIDYTTCYPAEHCGLVKTWPKQGC